MRRLSGRAERRKALRQRPGPVSRGRRARCFSSASPSPRRCGRCGSPYSAAPPSWDRWRILSWSRCRGRCSPEAFCCGPQTPGCRSRRRRRRSSSARACGCSSGPACAPPPCRGRPSSRARGRVLRSAPGFCCSAPSPRGRAGASVWFCSAWHSSHSSSAACSCRGLPCRSCFSRTEALCCASTGGPRGTSGPSRRAPSRAARPVRLAPGRSSAAPWAARGAFASDAPSFPSAGGARPPSGGSTGLLL